MMLIRCDSLEIRDLMMNGQAMVALEQLRHHFPSIFNSSDYDIEFALHCVHFIHLIKNMEMDSAYTFADEVWFKSRLMASCSPHKSNRIKVQTIFHLQPYVLIPALSIPIAISISLPTSTYISISILITTSSPSRPLQELCSLLSHRDPFNAGAVSLYIGDGFIESQWNLVDNAIRGQCDKHTHRHTHTHTLHVCCENTMADCLTFMQRFCKCRTRVWRPISNTWLASSTLPHRRLHTTST